MNQSSSFTLGWFSLGIAGFGALYYAKRQIEKTKADRFQETEAKNQEQERRNIEKFERKLQQEAQARRAALTTTANPSSSDTKEKPS